MELLIILTLILVIIIGKAIFDKFHVHKTEISIKESYDLTELPIVTLTHNSNKLNFMLDTGSNDSLFASKFKPLLNITKVYKKENVMSGFGGVDTIQTQSCSIELGYKDIIYETDILIVDHLNEAFEQIKAENGVQIHGILGTKFFEKYKYVIDFENLKAYQR